MGAQPLGPLPGVAPVVALHPNSFRYYQGPPALLSDKAFARGYQHQRNAMQARQVGKGIAVVAGVGLFFFVSAVLIIAFNL
jgi:hypothetical protein